MWRNDRDDQDREKEGDKGQDRPPRRDFGDRPPRREFGDRDGGGGFRDRSFGGDRREGGGGFRDRREGGGDRGGYGGGGFRDRSFGGDRREGGGYGGGGFRERRDDSWRDRRDPRDQPAPREINESVFSKKLRAGKRRTYFFDVQRTRGEDYFITLTESTRKLNGFGYERHKMFLYKEDFNRFIEHLQEVIDHVKTELMPNFDYDEFARRQAEWEAQNRESDEDSGDENAPTDEADGTDEKPKAEKSEDEEWG